MDNSRRRVGCAIFLVLALAALGVVRAQSLPGLALNGNQFTYDAPDGQVTGILLKPAGNGPFPALLISHGKGGNATAFSLSHANTFVRWGFVCIGPNYTHANTGSTPDDEGYSPENSRRARRALEILAATPGVDPARIGAFAHSMGAYLTGGLLGETGVPIRAAAIAAGGTSGTTLSNIASPSTVEVAGIRAPLLMFHGTADTTVSPQQSATLQTLLQSAAVPNRRLLYQGVNHNIVDATIKRADAYAATQAWFTQHGVLAGPGNTAPTISVPANISVSGGTSSAPIPLTISDAETGASALVLQAFSLDSDVAATAQSSGYTGRLPNSGLVITGVGASRTLTITPRAGVTGTVEVLLVVSEPEGVGALAASAIVRVEIGGASALPASTGDTRVTNLSARGEVSATEPLIAGFVVVGSGSRTVLLRAIGPSLAPFGVSGALANPRLQLYAGDVSAQANDDWPAGDAPAVVAAAASAGAFPLPANSRDAALVTTLSPGQYSVHAQTASGGGTALVEVYDLEGQGSARLANLSLRSRAGGARGPLIAGFAIAGNGQRALLLRAIGPGLAQFGVAGTLANPQLQLHSGSTLLLANDDWGQAANAGIVPAFALQSGAFALPTDSRDAVIATALAPATYSVVVPTTSAAVAGEVLVELYTP